MLPKEDDPFTDEQLDDVRGAIPTRSPRCATTIFTTIDPNLTFADPERRALAEAAGLHNIEVVEDPEVRRKLTPEHAVRLQATAGVERLLPDVQPCRNVELVTDPITEITEHAVVTADGRPVAVDTIILATGFATTKFLGALDVVGRDGVAHRRRVGRRPAGVPRHHHHRASRTCSCSTARTPTTARSST